MFADTERGRTVIHKVPTSPEDPSLAAMRGIVELCTRHDVATDGIDHVFHGTTIATNAVLQYDGAKTGMITNEGYRDILHIGRHQRPQNYSIMQDIPWQDRPLVRRRHRKVVRGRLAPPDGEVLEPMDEEGVRRAARALKLEGVESVAICFLFSYIDSCHETRGQGDRGRGVPAGLRHHLGRRRAPVPRVRAIYHGGDERFHRSQGTRLCREFRPVGSNGADSAPSFTSWARTAASRPRRRLPNDPC